MPYVLFFMMLLAMVLFLLETMSMPYTFSSTWMGWLTPMLVALVLYRKSPAPVLFVRVRLFTVMLVQFISEILPMLLTPSA